jgi:hypothetical protein
MAAGCQQRDEMEVAKSLLENLNKRVPGSSFRTDLTKCTVESVENDGYRVTLRESSFDTDFTWITNAILKGPFTSTSVEGCSEIGSVTIETMVFLYDPDKEFIQHESMTGFEIEMSYEKPARIMGYTMKRARARIKGGATKKWDIRKLIEDGRSISRDERRQFLDNDLDGLKVELWGTNEKNDELVLEIEIADVSGISQGIEDPRVKEPIFDIDAPRPDLEELLQKGVAVVDGKLSAKDIGIKIMKNHNDFANAAIEAIIFETYIRPDEAREFFEAGYQLSISHVSLDIPGAREYEILYGLRDLEFSFVFRQVNCELVQILLDLSQEAFQLRDQSDNAKMKVVARHTMRLLQEAMKSPPIVNMSIPRLRHYFGEMNMNSEILLIDPLTLQITTEVELKDVDNSLAKMHDSGMFSNSNLERIKSWIDQSMTRNEKGDARLLTKRVQSWPSLIMANGVQ